MLENQKYISILMMNNKSNCFKMAYKIMETRCIYNRHICIFTLVYINSMN